MLTFAGNLPAFRTAGLVIILLQLSVFVFGLPPFHTGYWMKTEPQQLVIYLLAVLNCAWLWWGFYKQYLLASRPTHPALYALFAWLLLQSVATLFAASPWRSWFGAPSNSESAGWFFCVALSAALLAPLWQHAASRRIILRVAALNLAILCALHVAHPNVFDLWSPSLWPDYLAFMIGWCWLAFMVSGGCARKHFFLSLPLLALGLFISTNRTAGVFFALALLASTAGYYLKITPGSRCKILLMSLCAAPMLLAALSPYHLKQGKETSSSERATLSAIALSTLAHEPSRLWLGDGWGRFNDDSFKYALVGNVRRFEDGKNNENAFLVSNEAQHVHNQPLEALLSLGLGGFVLWFAVPMLFIGRLPAAHVWPLAPMIAALAALGHAWFFTLPMLAYLALAWVALLSLSPPEAKPRAAQKLSLLFIPLMFLMLWSGWQQWSAMRYGETLNVAWRTQPADSISEAFIATDIARGGDRLYAIATDFARCLIVSQTAPTPECPRRIDQDSARWLAHFLTAAHQMALTPNIGVRASSLELLLQNVLMANLSHPAFAGLEASSDPRFPASILALDARAPQREDMAALYLYRLEKEKSPALPALLEQLLAQNPNHRPALWLTGKSLPAPQGQATMKHALELGVDKVYPITKEEMAEFSK